MATYTFAQALSKLNTLLDDSANTTWSNDEKTEFLTEVIENDPAFFTYVTDSSLTTIANQATYTVPATMEEVYDVALNINSDGFAHSLSRDDWEVIDGTLRLDPSTKGLEASKTIYLFGKKRLTTSDSIPHHLLKYLLEKACAEAFEFLSTQLGSRFLKNDMTMSELRAKIAAHEIKAERYRGQIKNKRPLAF